MKEQDIITPDSLLPAIRQYRHNTGGGFVIGLDHAVTMEVFGAKDAEIKHLHAALHDAINSPKGVVPESAERFYDQDYYDKKSGSD